MYKCLGKMDSYSYFQKLFPPPLPFLWVPFFFVIAVVAVHAPGSWERAEVGSVVLRAAFFLLVGYFWLFWGPPFCFPSRRSLELMKTPMCDVSSQLAVNCTSSMT